MNEGTTICLNDKLKTEFLIDEGIDSVHFELYYDWDQENYSTIDRGKVYALSPEEAIQMGEALIFYGQLAKEKQSAELDL
jgi:hypothetical protein